MKTASADQLRARAALLTIAHWGEDQPPRRDWGLLVVLAGLATMAFAVFWCAILSG